MFTAIHPKLPMRNKSITREFYTNQLGFIDIETSDYDGYLMMGNDQIQIHFFEFKELNPKENYGQVYIRTDSIHELYRQLILKGVEIHPNAPLQRKPWGQFEFSLLDPDFNLLTFGQSLEDGL